MRGRGRAWTGTALAAALAALALAACSQGALPKDALDTAVNDAVGDPNTCVLIGSAGGGTVYRFGSHVACGHPWPDCAGGQRSAEDLLKQVLKSGAPVAASCDSNADGSRGVGWAAGPVEGKPLSYAAAMEGEATPPGLIIADKLKAAFKRAGL